ncbi:unnamed protein product [Prorocentrum cordatum]|uniref:Fe2OG dioxygenase domain-containing protein n=1 Tax=Prorocentrum cordatum TaxID=2364126 RepID=A0ABN9XV19_9DINO|nr:unnamed protein product [Polarella glacialis]
MRLRAARGRAVAAALARPTRGLAALATKPYRLPEQLRGRPGRSDQAVQVDLSSVPQRGGAAVLEPGLVVLRGALDAAEQRRLGSEAWAAGCGQRNPAHTFFEADGSLRGPRGTRGRIFDACLRFGPRLTGLLLPACAAWVSRARALDASMPGHEASHLLMLYYPEGGTLGFHRDEQANDGTGDEPVVNLSLGGEMDFAVRHQGVWAAWTPPECSRCAPATWCSSAAPVGGCSTPWWPRGERPRGRRCCRMPPRAVG